jgi:hypothetical protein
MLTSNRKDHAMPGEDRTGPLGEGPRTGRGLGRCHDDEETKKDGDREVDLRRTGLGRGRGRGGGRGRGRGGGQGRGFRNRGGGRNDGA